MNHLGLGNAVLKLLLLGGLALGAIALTTDARRAGSLTHAIAASFTRSPDPQAIRRQPDDCQAEVQEGVIISREQLAAFLTVSERDARSRVEEILQTPYCTLAQLEVRAGVQAERAVYPLAFDPQTWLVVLYEGEEYAGYQFRIQR